MVDSAKHKNLVYLEAIMMFSSPARKVLQITSKWGGKGNKLRGKFGLFRGFRRRNKSYL